MAPNLNYMSDSTIGKRKRCPKFHKDLVSTRLDVMSMIHNVSCTFKWLFSGNSLKWLILISDFDIRFNKEVVYIVEAKQCLHPFDSFESFNKKYLNVLYDHYSVNFSGHHDKNMLLNEHTHCKKTCGRVWERINWKGDIWRD